ncbi:MAG: cytochrome C oxidase subunit IV family protein [Acidobacteria bacterium]|nr:cytochrome C oxidase subunit IV family protein [Acidobacteriota bacterium]
MNDHAVAAHDSHDIPHDDHNSPEHIKREIRVYLMVLGALAVLTGVTVFACYGLHLPIHYAVMVALAVASVKGFLVAGFFMHLLSEKKLIYGILILTVVFFAILLWGPAHDIADKFHY